jgi:hypothetical protein
MSGSKSWLEWNLPDFSNVDQYPHCWPHQRQFISAGLWYAIVDQFYFRQLNSASFLGGLPNNLLRPDVEQVLPSLGCAFSRCILQKKEVYCG